MYYLAEKRETACDINGSVYWLLRYYSATLQGDPSVSQNMIFDRVIDVLNNSLYSRLVSFAPNYCYAEWKRHKSDIVDSFPKMKPEEQLRKFYQWLLQPTNL